MKKYSRAYAQIDLDAVSYNMEQMKQHIQKDTEIMAVIKTDGYGHGAVPIAQHIQELEYLNGFAVAIAEEAFILRRHGITKPILILGCLYPEHYEQLIQEDIRMNIFEYEAARQLSKTAVKLGKKAYLHVKVDTAMSRLGIRPGRAAAELIKAMAKLPNIELEGIFTHFAKADEKDKAPSFEQMRKFNEFIRVLEKEGIMFRLKHCSNSAGIIDLKEANMDIVRAGISLYGLYPSSDVCKDNISLKPVLSLKSRIVYLKEVEAGVSVSYGGTYTTTERTKIATIPLGYGDGYPRTLSNKGYVLIRGKKAPILGRICMDQFMVDVTHIEQVQQNDEVILIGESGQEKLPVEVLSELCGRFNYEFVCDLGKRIPRVFVSGGSVTGTKDYFNE